MRSHAALSFLLVFALAFGGWVGSADAKEVVLVMKDGRRIKGELVSQTDEIVTIKIGTITTPFPTEGIQRVEEKQSLPDLVEEWGQGIKPNELDKRLVLARRVFDHKFEGIPSNEAQLEKYQLAAKELRDILKLNPNHEQAKVLLGASNEWISYYQGLIKPKVDKPPVVVDPPPPPVEISDVPKLSEKEINWLRLYEYDFRDRLKPQVNISNEVLDQLFSKHAMDSRVPKGNAARMDLRRKQGFEKLDLLFQVQDRDLWGQAEVKGDPQAFRTFKTKVHRNYVLSYCATADCHGGPKGGSLLLARDKPISDETVYTNFYILHQARGPGGAMMIDRDQPNLSLLVQYGIPVDRAAIKHPDVPGWTPNPAMAAGERSKLYEELTQWIGRELYRPTPQYEAAIEYKAPRGKASSPPAEAAPKADGAADAPPSK